METQSSPGSARSSAKKGLAYLPYLTIGDIVHLRKEGIADLESLEARLLEVPEPVWPHVLDLVRARVLEVPRRTSRSNGDGSTCLALTRSGSRCNNPPREGSDYCASHKGYQPTEAEREARQRGILPS